MINILIRLHNNLDKFTQTLDSILIQTYQDYRIIVSVDNLELFVKVKSQHKSCKFIYIDPSDLNPGIKTEEIDPNCPDKNNSIYGELFIPNIYFNILHYYINDGYILYLDNGDTIIEKDMFKECSELFSNKENIIWQIIAKNNTLSPLNWRGFPVLSSIDTTNIMFHKEYIQSWTGYRCGDFRIIKEICKKNNSIFIPRIYIKKDRG